MSKIFDGLKKTEGDIARLTIEVLGDNNSIRSSGNGKGAAASDVVELHSSRRKSEAAERFSDSGFVYEDGASYHAPVEAPIPAAPPSAERVAPEVEDLGQSDYTPEMEERSAEEFENFDTPPAAFSLGYRSAVIRIRSGAPVLPFDSGVADSAAEEYRRIRTRIIQHHLHPRLIAVTSPSPGDGKSVTSLNVAGALALNRDARVLLVDTDLRRPTISSLLGIPESLGVSDVLTGACTLENAVIRLEPFPNLFLIPAGKDRRNPAELFSSPRWKSLCEELRNAMTYTIFDGPPVDAVAEYSLLEEISDGLILVVRTNHTVRSLLNGALEAIPKAKLVGSVINGYKESFFWKQRGDYYY